MYSCIQVQSVCVEESSLIVCIPHTHTVYLGNVYNSVGIHVECILTCKCITNEVVAVHGIPQDNCNESSVNAFYESYIN
jgi:hypothetical protein